MFRGTERYPADVYNRVITTIGADANAYTTDDHTAYHLSMAAEDLEQVMELESDRFQNLSYAESAFQTEAGAVYGEYRKIAHGPRVRALRGARRRRVRAPSVRPHDARLRARHRDHADAVRLLARVLRPLLPAREHRAVHRRRRDARRACSRSSRSTTAAGSAATWRRRSPWSPSRRPSGASTSRYDGQTLPLLLLAYKLPVYDPADRTRVAADLFADLAFGETSEAYRRLVLDEQVVEDLDAGASYNRDPGLLEISARVKDPAKVDYVLGVIDETIAKLRAEPPDAAASRRSTAAPALRLPDGPADAGRRRVARRAVRRAARRSHGPRPPVRDVRRRSRRPTCSAAAERYLRAERRTVGVLRRGHEPDSRRIGAAALAVLSAGCSHADARRARRHRTRGFRRGTAERPCRSHDLVLAAICRRLAERSARQGRPRVS